MRIGVAVLLLAVACSDDEPTRRVSAPRETAERVVEKAEAPEPEAPPIDPHELVKQLHDFEQRYKTIAEFKKLGAKAAPVLHRLGLGDLVRHGRFKPALAGAPARAAG